jgi:hypothetical protein
MPLGKSLFAKLVTSFPWSRTNLVASSASGISPGSLKTNHNNLGHCKPFMYLDFEIIFCIVSPSNEKLRFLIAPNVFFIKTGTAPIYFALRGLRHGSAPNLLSNNFSNLTIKPPSPLGRPVKQNMRCPYFMEANLILSTRSLFSGGWWGRRINRRANRIRHCKG